MQELANFVNVLPPIVRSRHWSVVAYESSFWKFFKPDIASASILNAVIFTKRLDGDYLPEIFFYTNAIYFIWVNVDKSYFSVVFDRSRANPFVAKNENYISMIVASFITFWVNFLIFESILFFWRFYYGNNRVK